MGHLQAHELIHTGKKPHQCTQCGHRFYQPWSLKVHMRIHTGEKPYQCEECGVWFRHVGSLKNHTQKIHAEKKPHKCKQCGECFSLSSLLKKHITAHCKQATDEHEMCGKSVRQSKSGEKPLKFKQHGLNESQSLLTQKRRSTVNNRYTCKICGKCFSQPGNCQRHLRTHTGEKPYKCNVCGKCFAQSSNCQRHEQLHTVKLATQYQCKLCCRYFSSSQNLQKHENHFTCRQCGICFPQVKSLKKHVNSHGSKETVSDSSQLGTQVSPLQKHKTSDDKHICWICSKEFSSQVQLRKHYDDHLKNIPFSK